MMEDARHSIKRLDEAVVNRIAAGEVIQRPANAIKEMLENSLDAGSTSITVSTKSGGLKMLQISDNGHGIRMDDLSIVCERFTTSKLHEFDDLKSITTFGFRGEALASISHVAHLSITSRTKHSKCAYKSSYLDGKLVGVPKPTAGNSGTQITVEDLFYNVPTRRKAFKNPSEEHQKITDVITKYAIHNSGISVTLRKADSESAQASHVTIRTQPGATTVNNIISIYGANTGKDLIDVTYEDKKLKVKVNGYISNANCSMKKFTFLLFINNRLVECAALKRALDSVYQTYLPKGGHPFMYLSLNMAPNNLDVNIHPTKHEVHFLHEEAVIEFVQKSVEERLLSCNSSRTFYTQKLLPTSVKVCVDENKKQGTKRDQPSKVYDHQLVRTDSKLQKLDAFLVKPNKQQTSSLQTHANDEKNMKISSKLTIAELPKRRQIRLTSVHQLQDNIKATCSNELLKLLRDHTFVGIVDAELSLIQHLTKLYLVNVTKLTEELFYQLLLTDFGNFGMFRLSEPLSIYELALLALDCEESGWKPADGSKHNLAEYLVTFFNEKSEMLKDYFCFDIKNNTIAGIPFILQRYKPSMVGLPMLVLRLSTEVNWESEKDCFDSLCRELARFYSVRKGHTDCEEIIGNQHVANSTKNIDKIIADGDTEVRDMTSQEVMSQESDASWEWSIEHVVFPALRSHLTPNKIMSEDGTFLQLANLSELYKVFERC